MQVDTGVTDAEIAAYRFKLEAMLKGSGYYLNPDNEFTGNLIRGLIINGRRYGYESCPCRLSGGTLEKDKDIICPCDYRDDDVSEFGACYCALYVSRDAVEGKREVKPVPERRGKKKAGKAKDKTFFPGLSHDVWRCAVCGYLCARTTPPDVCPVCKAKKDRFEVFVKA